MRIGWLGLGMMPLENVVGDGAFAIQEVIGGSRAEVVDDVDVDVAAGVRIVQAEDAALVRCG